MAAAEMEVGGLGLEKLDTEIKNIHTQEVLGVRHVVPRTHVSHAILHENTSQDRYLRMKLEVLRLQRSRFAFASDVTKRAFVERQAAKNKKWKRDDDFRMTSLNIPQLRGSAIEKNYRGKGRRPSAQHLYRGPKYYEPDAPSIGQVILPYMRIERERTEVIKHKDRTFITRMPTNVSIDTTDFKRYTRYCGTDRLPTNVVEDNRFTKLANSLSPLKRSSTDIQTKPENNNISEKLTRRFTDVFYNHASPVPTTSRGRQLQTYVRTASRRRPRENADDTGEAVLPSPGIDRVPTVIITGTSEGPKQRTDHNIISGNTPRTEDSKLTVRKESRKNAQKSKKMMSDGKTRDLAQLQKIHGKLMKITTQKENAKDSESSVKLPKIDT